MCCVITCTKNRACFVKFGKEPCSEAFESKIFVCKILIRSVLPTSHVLRWVVPQTI